MATKLFLPKLNADGLVGYINTGPDDASYGQPVYQDEWGNFFWKTKAADGRSETTIYSGNTPPDGLSPTPPPTTNLNYAAPYVSAQQSVNNQPATTTPTPGLPTGVPVGYALPGATNTDWQPVATATPIPAPTSPTPVPSPTPTTSPSTLGVPGVDPYAKLPTETIDQYNARIAALKTNLPAPGTTSPTGVTNTASVVTNTAPVVSPAPAPTTPAPTTTATPSTLGVPGVDPFAKLPTETITQYNARIAAAYPNLPAPGTTSPTGVTNTATAGQIIPQYVKSPTETIDQYNARVAGVTSGVNLATATPASITPIATPPPPPPPPQTTISNPVAPPSTSGAPAPISFPTPTGGNVADQFNTALNTQLAAQKAALQAEADKRAAEYQAQIDALNKQQQTITANQDAAMASTKDVMLKEVADKTAALELEKKQYQENYDARQALTNELDTLLSTSNQIIEQMRNTTGLASIMNPRIAKTMSDVAARAGVIQAVMAAREGQIGLAQSQLRTSIDAIDAIAQDQLNYYHTIVDYYQNQKEQNGKKLFSLTNDQKASLDVKLSTTQSDLERTQATAAIIQKAMLDPDTAMEYAKAGVSLNDS